MRSRLLVLMIVTAFFTQPVFAYNRVGMIVTGSLAGAGAISLMISGILMGTAFDTTYCPAGTQEAISGTYNCSYQVCTAFQYIEDYKTTCVTWNTIPQTCNKTACQDQTTHQFQDYSGGKNQPGYDNARIATIVSGAVTSAALVGMVVSYFACGRGSGGDNAPPVVTAGKV